MKSEVELRVYARMGAQSKRSRRPNRSEGHALGEPCRMCAHLRGMCRRAAGPRAALGVGQHDDTGTATGAHTRHTHHTHTRSRFFRELNP